MSDSEQSPLSSRSNRGGRTKSNLAPTSPKLTKESKAMEQLPVIYKALSDAGNSILTDGFDI